MPGPVELLLVRHGHTAAVGRTLAGRAPGLGLSAAGRAEVAALAERLAGAPLAGVHASPLARTLETAAAIARPHGLAVQADAGLLELDFGAWTGCAIDALAGDPAWERWNRQRGEAVIPGGEAAVALQARALDAVRRITSAYAGARVVVVSHADVIRAMLGGLLGIPLDRQLHLEVSTATVSAVELWPSWHRVTRINAPH